MADKPTSTTATTAGALLPRIEGRIQVVQDLRVMIDADLAELYGVPTKALNQAVKRNASRFPPDFMFQLNAAEKAEVVTNCDHLSKLKFSKSMPYASTEHGAIQAANVLNSPRAIAMGVFVVRAFVRLRELLASNSALSRKLDELERKYKHHDEAITAILSAIRELTNPPAPKRRSIGFTADLSEKS